LAILESGAVSAAIPLVSWPPRRRRRSLFALPSRIGRILQCHNSARNFRLAGERISTTSIQEGASGIPRIPLRKRWSSVWNLVEASCILRSFSLAALLEARVSSRESIGEIGMAEEVKKC